MQIIICCIICVFGMMILGVPLITAFLGGSIIPLALFSSMPIDVITNKMFASINSFSFLAVPFFMICGGLMDKGGIAKRLVDLAKSLVGWLPGCLAVCTFVASAFFGAVSGSAVATIVATGCRIAKMEDFPIADMIPAMLLVMPISWMWTSYIVPLM